MALTETQRTNAAILAAQGDIPEAIAHHVAAPLSEVRKALGIKTERRSNKPADEKPVDDEAEKPVDDEAEKPVDDEAEKPVDEKQD